MKITKLDKLANSVWKLASKQKTWLASAQEAFSDGFDGFSRAMQELPENANPKTADPMISNQQLLDLSKEIKEQFKNLSEVHKTLQNLFITVDQNSRQTTDVKPTDVKLKKK